MREKEGILLRPEEPRDFAAIREIHQLSFGRENEAVLVEKLRGSRDFIPALSLVAECEGRVAGHILFSRVWIRPSDPNLPEEVSLALAPLAVHPDFRNKGIGSELVTQGLKICRQYGHRLVIVVGEQSYYARFGFVPARPKGLEVPFPVPERAFLVAEVIPHPGPGLKGTIRFPPAFMDVV
ncbi:MAG: N-acetyltransferase [Candidatus Aminicenantes bacterium]|nr:N-acetyltransferase [Candidatus Aminicenantes bacterium]